MVATTSPGSAQHDHQQAGPNPVEARGCRGEDKLHVCVFSLFFDASLFMLMRCGMNFLIFTERFIHFCCWLGAKIFLHADPKER